MSACATFHPAASFACFSSCVFFAHFAPWREKIVPRKRMTFQDRLHQLQTAHAAIRGCSLSPSWYNFGITMSRTIKTAISLNRDLFERGEQLAGEMQISRSRLFAL